MDKQKIFTPIIIVILLIILIFSYILIFGQRQKEGDGKGEGETEEETLITPPVELDYDQQFMKEFNEAEVRVEYKYTLSSGDSVTIKIPQGIDPPPQEVVERMWKNRQ